MADNAETSFNSSVQENPEEMKVVTMVDVLNEVQELEEDANAVLGGSDDKNCTYSKGYLKRQALYACVTCIPESKTDPSKRAGVCLACSYDCHENHELIELYTKRNFRCDCGNRKFPSTKKCKLEPVKCETNEDNIYNNNFSGLYCSCKRPYPDPEDSTVDDMIQCIVCEDWHHSRHLGGDVPPLSTYSEMICGSCISNHEFIRNYGGYAICKVGEEVNPVLPKIVRVGNETEAIDVGNEKGEQSSLLDDTTDSKDTKDVSDTSDSKDTKDSLDTSDTKDTSDTSVTKNTKDSSDTSVTKDTKDISDTSDCKDTKDISDTSDCKDTKDISDTSDSKDTKDTTETKDTTDTKDATDIDTTVSSVTTISSVKSSASSCKMPLTKSNTKGALFWPENWRQFLCKCAECTTLYQSQNVAYLVDAQDTVQFYEEKGKAKAPENSGSQYEEGMKALSSLDRIKQVEVVSEYNDMKDQLKDYLQKFVDNKKVVREEDIREFFSTMAANKKQKVDMPYFCR